MRLFAAIELGEALQARLQALVAELRRRAAAARGARLTWVDPSCMHLTVRFVGDVDAARVDRIRDALARPLDAPSFDLECGGLLALPSRRLPRVIACGVVRGATEASLVEALIGERLDRVDIRREARAYHPHVTLARVREAGALRTAPLFDGLEDALAGSTRVEAITLFESRLSQRGPTYTALMRVPLAA